MIAQNINLRFTFARLKATKEPVCLLSGKFEKQDDCLFWSIDEFSDPYACEFAQISLLDEYPSFGWHSQIGLDEDCDNVVIQIDEISISERTYDLLYNKVKKIKTWYEFVADGSHNIQKVCQEAEK